MWRPLVFSLPAFLLAILLAFLLGLILEYEYQNIRKEQEAKPSSTYISHDFPTVGAGHLTLVDPVLKI